MSRRLSTIVRRYTDMTYEERVALVERKRKNKYEVRPALQQRKTKAKKAKEKTTTKKLNDLLAQLTPEQIAELIQDAEKEE